MAEEISLRDEIITLLDREPFVPFRIVMASGDKYEVTDPHRLALGQNLMILLPPRTTHVMMRFNQVSAVESEPEAG